MSCVRLGRGGEQVKQLFEDEIIVWLHPFTPMAHRGRAKQPSGLPYLISASASQGHFFQSSADGRSVPLLDLSSALLLSNHQCDGFTSDVSTAADGGV